MNPWRHVRAVLLLPFMVTVVVPCFVLTIASEFDSRWPPEFGLLPVYRGAAVAVALLGLALLVVTNLFFARIGEGTLAPWDPTRHLVVRGPYRVVRNPMISGVTMILAGEALFFGSGLLGAWAATFLLVNHLNFLFVEEPDLEMRFGADYRIYKEHVPRWIPRKGPWDPSNPDQ